jgi:putative aldouronate transport system substrate-binding protein
MFPKEELMKKILILACLIPGLLFANGSSETTKTAPTATSKTNIVNATGFPIVTEPLSMTVFGIRDSNQAPWKDIYVFNEYEKKTGIHMEWQETPDQGRDEKKSLLFAGNELPDLFFRPQLSLAEMEKYGVQSHQLMPLNDLLKNYAPNLTKILNENPELRKALTCSDGNIYGLPQLDFSATGSTGFKQWINKTWLAKLGLKEPTNTDEFLTVLRAFKTQDPNGNGEADEIPLGIRESSSIYQLGGSWGLEFQMGNTINVNDGKVHFWLKDAAFKEYLQYLNQLYKEGLLWKDYYKRDLPKWRSNLSTATFGAFYMPYSDVFRNVEDQFEGLTPLVGPHGDQIWSAVNGSLVSQGAFAISNVCKNPEAAIRWVDYFYGDEGALFFRYGVEGVTYDLDADGQPQFKDSILNDPKGFMTALGKINTVPGGANPTVITDETDGVVASKLTKEVAAMMMPYVPKKIYLTPSFNQDEMDEYIAITQDLNTYRDQAVTKFIIGEWGFDKWDEYCTTLDKIGLPKLEQIYQQASDR